MINKIGICMYVIGFILYIAFLSLINTEFGSVAGIYTILSNIGTAICTFGLNSKRLMEDK